MQAATLKIHDESELPARYLSILIVDDDDGIRGACKEAAENMGFKVYDAEDAGSAIRLLGQHSPNVVVLDLKLPGSDGLELLPQIKQLHPSAEVIIVTGHATVDSALAAMKSGAYDYLRKPFDLGELRRLLEKVAERIRFSLPGFAARESNAYGDGYGGIVGKSPEMERLYRIIAKVAGSRHPVLIQGETGSGKELAARAIHFTGPFREKPFIPVDCSSLSSASLEIELFGCAKGVLPGAIEAKDGALKMANGGSVFLDAVSEMPIALQGKLLRAIQERELRPMGSAKSLPFNVRILAASSQDLELATRQGTFRRDLYSRLNVVSLRLPPLRDRKDDIPLLVDYFLDKICQRKGVQLGVNSDVMKQLLAYQWPGNVGELENCLEQASALNSDTTLQLADFPVQIQHASVQPIPVRPTNVVTNILPLAEVEKQAIIAALDHLRGDKLAAAKVLGIGKTTLYRKLKEYHVADDEESYCNAPGSSS